MLFRPRSHRHLHDASLSPLPMRIAPSLAWLAALPLVAACFRPVARPPEPERAPVHATERDSSREPEIPPAERPDGVSRSDWDYLLSRHLVVPVAGVPLDRIPDSFNDGREGHIHHAVDILAPRGTPVVAADDGRVLRLHSNKLGGITIYEVDPEARWVYYYAHLERYRRHLKEGMRLAKGDTIGYVGTTGNAPKNVPHLHFQVSRMPEDGKWWLGVPVDPRPLLENATTTAANEPDE